MLESPGAYEFGDSFDVYLSPDFSPELAMRVLSAADEETSGDSVPFRPQLETFYYGNVLHHGPFAVDQPDFNMDDTAAASVASHFHGGRVAGSHLPSHQSTAASGSRVEDISASGSSHSPASDPVILTPASSNALQSSRYLDGSESDDNLSPMSSGVVSNENELVARIQAMQTGDSLLTRRVTSNSMGWPPHSPSAISGVSDVHHRSRASSIATSYTHPEGMANWGALHAPIPGLNYSGHPESSQHNTYGAWNSDSFDSAIPSDVNQYMDDDVLQDLNSSSAPTALPIRTSGDGHAIGQTSFDPRYGFVPGHAQLQHHYVAPGTARIDGQRHNSHVILSSRGVPYGYAANTPSTYSATPTPATAGVPSNPQRQHGQHVSNRRRGQHQYYKPSPHRSTPVVPSQHTAMPAFLTQYSSVPTYFGPTAHQQQPTVPRPIAPSPASTVESLPPPPLPTGKGGRKKGVPLSNASRLQSSAMRKRTACWRCALQRDSVSRHRRNIRLPRCHC